ncbi:MAG: sel1 repeat family protein, partial [Neisseriaceae bacterium]|nr:sel1 repeat family protein [Neisseriaceae bacterium]
FYLTKACDGGVALACNSLGVRYSSGSIVGINYEKAHFFYTKACNQGKKQRKDFGGCFGLGQMYEHGNGVKKDLSTAQKYYRQACDLGDESGCSWYESMNRKDTTLSVAPTLPEIKTNAQICLNGKGQKATIKKACNDAFQDPNALEENKLKYLKQGCAFGDYFACVHLAYRYENGNTVQRNHQTAMSYLTRADKIACGNSKVCLNAAARQNKTFKVPKEDKTMVAQTPEGYPLVIFSDPKIQKVYKGISPEQFLRNVGLYESFMQLKNK